MCTAPNLSFCVGQVIHNRTKSTMLYIHKQQKYAVHPQMTESYCLFTNNSHAGHPQSCWPSTNRIMLAIHKQSYWPSTNNRIMLAIHKQSCWPSTNSPAGHPQTTESCCSFSNSRIMLAIHKQSCMLAIYKQQNHAVQASNSPAVQASNSPSTNNSHTGHPQIEACFPFTNNIIICMKK